MQLVMPTMIVFKLRRLQGGSWNREAGKGVFLLKKTHHMDLRGPHELSIAGRHGARTDRTGWCGLPVFASQGRSAVIRSSLCTNGVTTH